MLLYTLLFFNKNQIIFSETVEYYTFFFNKNQITFSEAHCSRTANLVGGGEVKSISDFLG